MGSFSARGSTLYRVLGGLAALLLVVWAVRFFVKTDAERVEESVYAARQALHEGRDDDFLAWFTADVDYQDGKGFDALRTDLSRWRRQARLRAFLDDPRIVVTDDRASVEIDARVGLNAIQAFPVHADLGLRKEAGTWRVSRVSWSRGPRPAKSR